MKNEFIEFLLSQIGDKTLGQIELSTGITKSYLSKVLRGERATPKPDTLKKLSKALPCSYEELMSKAGYIDDRHNEKKKGVRIPVLGTIPAGIPIEAIEDILDYEEISEEMASRGEFFALKVRGTSMTPEITDGEIAIIRKQDDADTGDICVVMVNGYDATLKRIKKSNKGILLVPTNMLEFEPVFYTNEDIINLPVRIIGKVVETRKTW